MVLALYLSVSEKSTWFGCFHLFLLKLKAQDPI